MTDRASPPDSVWKKKPRRRKTDIWEHFLIQKRQDSIFRVINVEITDDTGRDIAQFTGSGFKL